MAQQNLELILMEKLERQKNEIGATWVKMGDRCNKEFLTFTINPNLNPKFLELLDGKKNFECFRRHAQLHILLLQSYLHKR